MRARNIKPGFFRNPELCQMSESTRLLFIGLWCLADRLGRLEDRPTKIKIEIFPCDAHDITKMLDQLEKAGLIMRYQIASDRFIQILNFEKHQHPHHREPPSTLPAPGQPQASPGRAPGQTRASPSDSLIPDSLIPDSLIPTAYCADPKTASVPAPSILLGLSLYQRDQRLCKRLPDVLPSWQKAFPGVNLRTEICRAHAWELANPEKQKINRIKFLHNWLSRAQDQPKSQGEKSNGTHRSESIHEQAARFQATRDAKELRKAAPSGEIFDRIRSLSNVQTKTEPYSRE